MKFWLVIFTVGLLNYLSRLSFIAFFANRSMPPILGLALKYVPAAMLTALVVPMVLASPSLGSGLQVDARLPAAVIASAVAYFSHSTIATLASGMGALWVLRALGV